MKSLGIAFLALMLLAGCGANKEEGTATDSSMNGMPEHSMPNEAGAENAEPASAEPEVELKQYKLEAKVEREGDQIMILVDTDLTFSEEHYGQAHQYGEGHIHFYVGGGLKGPIMSNGPYAVDAALLATGDNVIKLTLAGNDHSEPYNASVELVIKKS